MTELNFTNKDTGDLIMLGQYPYEEDGSVAPLSWIIAEKSEDSCLLISEMGIENLPYNNGMLACTWADCHLRKQFCELVHKIFDDEILERIIPVTHTNIDNSYYFARGGEPSRGGKCTTDTLFIPDSADIKKYFPNEESRKLKPTPYAKKKGVFTNSDGYCSWWLREPGMKNLHAAFVRYDGSIVNQGYFVSNKDFAVRLAMWIKM